MPEAIVLGCGPTGSNWDGQGFCIGVNDCEKFGKPVSALVCVNSKFELERERIIKNTIAPHGFYSQLEYWVKQPNFKLLNFRTYEERKGVDPTKVYASHTSPFIAISLAVTLGYDSITLYGVDFIQHPIVKDDVLVREVDQYKKFIDQLNRLGKKVYLSTPVGALAIFLTVK